MLVLGFKVITHFYHVKVPVTESYSYRDSQRDSKIVFYEERANDVKYAL